MSRNPLEWRKPDGLTLDRDYEREIMRTAFVGRRADDPETAWFVAHFARDRVRLTWLYVGGIVLFTAQLVWAVARGSFEWWHLVIVVVVLWNVWFLYAYEASSPAERADRDVATGTRGAR